MFRRAVEQIGVDMLNNISSGVGVGLGSSGTKKKKSDNSMDTMDWVGMGLEVAGAIANQQEEEKALKLEQERYNQGLRIGNRNRMDQLKQNAIQNQQQDRSQNQSGLNYLTGLVDSNRAEAKKRVPSFRQTMLYGSL